MRAVRALCAARSHLRRRQRRAGCVFWEGLPRGRVGDGGFGHVNETSLQAARMDGVECHGLVGAHHDQGEQLAVPALLLIVRAESPCRPHTASISCNARACTRMPSMLRRCRGDGCVGPLNAQQKQAVFVFLVGRLSHPPGTAAPWRRAASSCCLRFSSVYGREAILGNDLFAMGCLSLSVSLEKQRRRAGEASVAAANDRAALAALSLQLLGSKPHK